VKQETQILFDGLTVEELSQLSWEEIEAWIVRDDPIVFRASEADVLAQFSLSEMVLTVQVSVVEGGGDGVLVQLFSVIEKMSRKHQVRKIIWQVHALNCMKPNPKLQRVLRGFDFYVVEPEDSVGYFEKITSINDSVLRRERLTQ